MSVLAARIVQFPPANPAGEYRLRSAQSNSAFDIGLHVRISGTTGEQSRRDSRSNCGASVDLTVYGFAPPNSFFSVRIGSSSVEAAFDGAGRLGAD